MSDSSRHFAVRGQRIGVQLAIPGSGPEPKARFVINGAIAADDAEAIKHLRDAGYQLDPSKAKPNFDPDAYQARRRLAGMLEAY